MNRDPSLQRWMTALRQGEAGDAELLAAFHAQHDEASFEVLVRRHGSMVLGVCRRLLGHDQDAEDAYQATFLVLARRAGDIRRPEQLANWLWGVAYRAGLEARQRRRRRAREQQVTDMHEPEAAPAPEPASDLNRVLDEELKRLPEKYRTAVVLCDLEGCTREEAAGRLGIPVGTLSGRLTTAHRKLAARLTRRGVAVAGLAAALGTANTAAGVPPTLSSATVTIGVQVAVGGLAASGASPSVAALVESVLQALRLARWKSLALMLTVSLAILVPGVGVARQVLQRPPELPTPVVEAPPPAPPAPAPAPDPGRFRDVPIANDLNDIFVVSDVQERLPEFFQNNRLLVAEMPSATVRNLATSTEPFVDIMLPINSVNDPQTSKAGGRNVPVVPPSEAVRKLLETAAAKQTAVNVIIRHEGTAGLFDVVGYTTRSAPNFFTKADSVTRAGDVKQTDLQYTEPGKVELPPGPIQAVSGQPRLFRISSSIRNARVKNPIEDIIILSDRQESVVEFFQRNRVAIGCITADDYEKLLRTQEPWLEIPAEPISFNDDASPLKRRGKMIRVARPWPTVEQQMMRPALRASPIKAMTVILRRDEPDGVFTIVGYPRYRTAFQFFDKDVRVGDSGTVTQKDLRFRPPDDK